MHPESNETEAPPWSLPLPRFRQPLSADPLPEETDDPSPASPPAAAGTTSPDPLSPTDQGPAAPPPLPDPNPARRTRTGTSSAGGDPTTAGQVIAGLIGVLCLVAFTMAGRRGLHFRQPTDPQIDAVSVPLGRIMARHLPTEVIGPDLVDATAAVAGAHRYVIDGPLVSRYAEPIPEELS